MVETDKQTFLKLASQGNLIPVYREILGDLDTPVSAYLKLNERPSILLESVEGGEKWARYSFLGLRPSKVIRGWGRRLEITDGQGRVERVETDDPVGYLRTIMAAYKPVPSEGLPRFYGGLVGYMGYDIVRFIERLPDKNAATLDMPDIFLMLADTLLIFDNLRQSIKVVSNVHIEDTPADAAFEAAQTKIESIIKKLRAPLPVPPTGPCDKPGTDFTSTSGSTGYMDAVAKSKEYILAGDIFQVVLSQRFERPSSARPIDIYRALRVINPSPYMYFLDTGEAQLVGSSPEILVRLEEDTVTLRPIAGTRKRGHTEDEDRALEADLKADPKEVAEHVMLVDLGRNDVGRVSKIGTVKVTGFMFVERYSHVMHMVSNVEGTLNAGMDSFDVLKACFPAGTVSGSPKIRAMAIIEELEPFRRGAYAGAVGYFGYSGNMDTCITIRTIIVKDGKVHVQAGAGIVADSVPEKEHQETVNKATGMMRAVEMAERGLA